MALHVIHFMNSINSETLSALQSASLGALREGATEIAIHLSSDGGSTDHGFAAYHFLRSLPVPLTMHCIGNVESMAIIMFLAGERRLAVPHAKFKIHPLHWGFNAGSVDHDRLVEFGESLDFDADRYAVIFEERTKNAEKPLDVRTHLAGRANIFGTTAAIDARLAIDISEVAIPAAAINWWV
ncbi:ATP-dependent Clp protease proteolytic subunit [Pseudomonas sp. NPDC090755]|uniref:ATP-dependent Clp protease proteolytic subunit n=1 Tax=Pseudomonas sp. NPDC090755 TaxID=3364481 RepID=UPI00383B392E